MILPLRPFLTIVMTFAAGPVTTALPASGGNTPGWPLPFSWWQLEQLVVNTLWPAAAEAPLAAAMVFDFVVVVIVFVVAAGLTAGLTAAVAAALAAGDAPGEVCVVVVVVVVVELLCFPPEHAASAAAAIAAVNTTVTDLCMPCFLSRKRLAEVLLLQTASASCRGRFSGRALMAHANETNKKFATSELPPYEMNGKVMPVSGKRPMTPPTMMNTWNPSVAPKPTASSRVYKSGCAPAIVMTRRTSNKKSASTITAPMRPNSSLSAA